MSAFIGQALTAGYTIGQIINWLRKNDRHWGPIIREAMKQGYTEEQIGEQITGQSSRSQYLQSAYTQPKGERKLLGAASAALPIALGSYGLAKAFQGPQKGQMTVLPPLPQQQSQSLLQAPQMGGFLPPPQPPQQPPPMGTMPPTQPQAQPGGPIGMPLPSPSGKTPITSPAPIPAMQVLKGFPNIASRVINLVHAGNTPENIVDYLKVFHSKDAKEIEKQSKRQLQDLVQEFAQQVPSKVGIQLEEQPQVEQVAQEVQPLQMDEATQTEQAPITLQKESVPIELPPIEKEKLDQEFNTTSAMLPNGEIGDIISVKKGIAEVNVNGKKSKYNLSQIIKEPVEIRNALHEILRIPESQRSGPMDLLYYTDKHKLLHIQYANGDIYWYEDIEPDLVDEILEAKGKPKTTGRTATGEEWTAGVPTSRFSVVDEKIKKNPKYAQGQEGITWGKVGKKYDKYQALRLKPKIKTKSSDDAKVLKKKTSKPKKPKKT